MRHRAGIGVTEANEAWRSSYPKKPARSATPNGAKLKMNISFAELEKLLNKDFSI
ncbi:hypothetical protein [Mucilaginibacter humi]|uniref:hypothetical protein n=1 Tax=Mucilaginibacter humi TaxID=2732510 RepID=UPI001FE93B1A|nr:hypothetical protein [Mucilaginibacter humi]